MSEYGLTATNIGLARQTNLGLQGKAITLAHVAFGDGVGELSADKEAMISERVRVPVNSVRVSETDPRIYIVETIIPSDVGGFDINEVGLFDEDGYLCYVAKYTGAYKPLPVEGVAEDYLIDFSIITSAEAIVNISVDPSKTTASREWAGNNFVMRLNTLADLRTYVGQSTQLLVLGSTQPGDGGGGFFTTDGTLEHVSDEENGISVIVSADTRLWTKSQTSKNYAPDFNHVLYAQGVLSFDGYGVHEKQSEDWVYPKMIDAPWSIYPHKKAIRYIGNKASNLDMDPTHFDPQPGETIYGAVSVYSPVDVTVHILSHLRRPVDGSNDETLAPAAPVEAYGLSLKAGVQRVLYMPVTVPEGGLQKGDYFQIRTNVEEEHIVYQIDAKGLFYKVPGRLDDVAPGLPSTTSRTPSFPARFGNQFLVKTKRSLTRLCAGVGNQINVGFFGDSYTHNDKLYVEALAKALVAYGGEGGGGWCSFGGKDVDGNPLTAEFPNGNARADLYSVTLEGTWDYSVYGQSSSPDLCHVSSSTPGDKITISGPNNPVLTKVTLLSAGTADGLMRYRFRNGGDWGDWHDRTVQNGTAGNLTTGDLVHDIPNSASNDFDLELEVVSGECVLMGANLATNADGVVVHGFGVTGSRAWQWAGHDGDGNEVVPISQWKKGPEALKLDLMTLMIGPNDQIAERTPEDFGADIALWISRCRSTNLDADLAVIIPCENHNNLPYQMSHYAFYAYRACKAANVAFYWYQDEFGRSPKDYALGSKYSQFKDLTHPDESEGGPHITGGLLNFIFGL